MINGEVRGIPTDHITMIHYRAEDSFCNPLLQTIGHLVLFLYQCIC